MTTQQGRDNQSSAGDHRKPRVPQPKAFESAQPCNLARCRDAGKTRSGMGHFTLLWRISKPACRALGCAVDAERAMHYLAALPMVLLCIEERSCGRRGSVPASDY